MPRVASRPQTPLAPVPGPPGAAEPTTQTFDDGSTLTNNGDGTFDSTNATDSGENFQQGDFEDMGSSDFG